LRIDFRKNEDFFPPPSSSSSSQNNKIKSLFISGYILKILHDFNINSLLLKIKEQ